jgi:hypothetical protein
MKNLFLARICGALGVFATLGLVVLVWIDAWSADAVPDAARTESRGVCINAVTRNLQKSKVSLTLAKDGKALLPIVVAEKAAEPTRLVAAELAGYLKQITGAPFEVKTGDGSAGIVLGTLAEFPNTDLAAPLEIRSRFDGREAYAIRTQPNRLLLIGATELGASHAAFRFLEELGCRWFFPAKEWEVVPSIRNLRFGTDITDRPSILSRSIWYGWWLFNDAGHPGGRSASADYGDWRRHNRQAESFVVNAGHALFKVIDENRAEFDAHPEYYALTGGKRQGPQIEVGNPAVRKMVVNYALNFFKQNPSADMVSVDPADGFGYSESEESQKLGTPSDAVFGMANEVAKVLQKEYPGKLVGLYAYNWHSDPPGFELEPNVYIQLTMGYIGGKYTLDELFELWPKKARNMGFYDYYSVWRWDFDRWPGGRISSANYPKEMFGRFKKAFALGGGAATSVSAESSNNWGPNGRGYYVANRLMWNPDESIEAILQDYYQKAFGPASAAMKRYYEMADNTPLMTDGVIGALFRFMDEATQAAKDRPDVQARLNDLKIYLRYEYLNWLKVREKDAAAAKQIEQEIFTLVYRTRYTYMNHWEAIRQDWVKEDPKIPDDQKPWKVNQPVTSSEIAAWFQKGLEYFPALEIPKQMEFSGELMPVNVSGEPLGFSGPDYQGGTRLILHSPKGEPLKFKLRSGAMYGGLKHSYTIKDTAGKVISEGKPKPNDKVDLAIAVPHPGLYYLDYVDAGGDTWAIKVPSTQILGFPLTKAPSTTTLYQTTPDLYFYVPKGTERIQYYFRRTPWSNSGPHTVIDPSGKIVRKVEADGEYLSVDVPPGMDGKTWRFGSPAGSSQGFGLGLFWFFNCPNYLSPSPAQMILPRDLAAKDGLKIIE